MLIVLFLVPINIDTYLLSSTSKGGGGAPVVTMPSCIGHTSFSSCMAREQGKGVVSNSGKSDGSKFP